jgi:hypothetical protein
VAIALRSEAHNDATSTTSCTISVPPGTLNGDLLLVFIVATQDASTFLAIDEVPGWAFAQGTGIGLSGGFLTLDTRYRVARAEPASYTWTYPSVAATPRMSGAIMALTGVDSGTPLDATTTTDFGFSAAGAEQVKPPLISTVTNGAWVFSIVATAGGANAAVVLYSAQPTGYLWDEHFLNRSGGAAHVLKASAGSENPGAWTSPAGQQAWSAHTIALRPSGPVPPRLISSRGF